MQATLQCSHHTVIKKKLKVIAYNHNYPKCIIAPGQNQFTSASPAECSSLQEERKRFIFEISFAIQAQKRKTNKTKKDKILQTILHKLQAIL